MDNCSPDCKVIWPAVPSKCCLAENGSSNSACSDPCRAIAGSLGFYGHGSGASPGLRFASAAALGTIPSHRLVDKSTDYPADHSFECGTGKYPATGHPPDLGFL